MKTLAVLLFAVAVCTLPAQAKKPDPKKFTETATMLASADSEGLLNGATRATMNVETLGLSHLMLRGHFLTIQIGKIDYIVRTNQSLAVGQSCPAYVDKKSVHLLCDGKETDAKIASEMESAPAAPAQQPH